MASMLHEYNIQEKNGLASTFDTKYEKEENKQHSDYAKWKKPQRKYRGEEGEREKGIKQRLMKNIFQKKCLKKQKKKLYDIFCTIEDTKKDKFDKRIKQR